MKTFICSVVLMIALGSPAQEINAQPIKRTVSNQWPIIKRQGDILVEGDKPFRFLGLAAPNIQQNESQLLPDMSNRFPDEYEIRDVLDALRRIGSRATRTFSLSVYSPKDNGMPVYISGHRQYNEDAFRCLDRILALAPEYDIRLIIPFIASQSFNGIRGVDEFAALSGKNGQGSFWTDEQVKEDFRHFLVFLLNRKNSINGKLYKDDPAILAWQLGNEFGSFSGDRGLSYDAWKGPIGKWSNEMAAFIKSQDPNHLVMEAGGADRDVFLNDPNIDVMSDHLYEYWSRMSGKSWDLSAQALESINQCRGKKPLMVDEFGLGSYENQKNLMKTIRESSICGGLMWSIRGHRRDGGWYYHNEGGTPVNSFHVPGFAVGHAYEEKRMLDLLKMEAYRIRGLAIPAEVVPNPTPVLIKVKEGFTWRGSTGAAYYTLERATSSRGPWKIIATGLHDSVIADVVNFEHTPRASYPLVLFVDETAEEGKTYYYRARAENSAGTSGYSDVVEVN